METASQAGAACVIVMAVACPEPRLEGIPHPERRIAIIDVDAIRHTHVIDMIREPKTYNARIDVDDP